jgi:hypothetical protein
MFNEWDYDNNVLLRWLRYGECNQCGECCRGTITLTGGPDDDARNGCNGTDETGQWFERVPIEEPRRLIRVDEINRDKDPGHKETCYEGALCKEHDEKCFICQAWPMSPDQVEPFDNCSYSFYLLNVWEIEDHDV